MQPSPAVKGRKTLSLNRPKTPQNRVVKTQPNEPSKGVASIRKTPKQKGKTFASSPRPPEQLIRTWIWMWQSGPSITVKEEGKRKLVQAFGSIELLTDYIREHK